MVVKRVTSTLPSSSVPVNFKEEKSTTGTIFKIVIYLSPITLYRKHTMVCNLYSVFVIVAIVIIIDGTAVSIYK